MIYIIHITTIDLFMVEWCVEAEEKILRTTNISTAEDGKTRKKKNEHGDQAIALN